MPRLTETLAERAIERSVADRRIVYVQEMQRIVDATYRLIEGTGTLDPPLRDVLREAGLSTQAFYRYFRSKDELLLLLLDNGRRELLGYLEHRMERAASTEGRVRAWIEGVLAQASDPGAAARTRPFLANQDRLAEAFPDEQQASVDLLTGLLAGAIARLPRIQAKRRDPLRDAEAIYYLVFGKLHHHLIHNSQPAAAEVDHLVRFSLNGILGSATTT